MNTSMKELLEDVIPEIILMGLQQQVINLSLTESEGFGLDSNDKKLLKSLKRIVKAYEEGYL